MELLISWGAHSPRMNQPLARECPYCDSPAGRLRQHRAGERRAVSLAAPRPGLAGVGRRAASAAGAA
jgi:hypothetical protein